MKKVIIWVLVGALLAGGAYYYFSVVGGLDDLIEEKNQIIEEYESIIQIEKVKNKHIEELLIKTESAKKEQIDRLKQELDKKPKVVVKTVEGKTEYIVDNSGIEKAVDETIKKFLEKEKVLNQIISDLRFGISQRDRTIKRLIANSNKIVKRKMPLLTLSIGYSAIITPDGEIHHGLGLHFGVNVSRLFKLK